MSSNQLKLAYDITPVWDVVNEIREQISSSFNEGERKIAAETMMTASELIENAIKYGKSNIEFKYENDNNRIRIEVANKIASDADLDLLRKHFTELYNEVHPQTIYVKRLLDMANGGSAGRRQPLGIFRIVAEGGFKLHYTCEGDMLTVVAEKNY